MALFAIPMMANVTARKATEVINVKIHALQTDMAKIVLRFAVVRTAASAITSPENVTAHQVSLDHCKHSNTIYFFRLN